MLIDRRSFLGTAFAGPWAGTAEEKPGHRLYACAATSKDYVLGAKLPPSGLFLRQASTWRQLGYNHPYIVGLDYDPRDPRVIYLAAGNGCVGSPDGGGSWRILTGWQETELQDAAVDPNQPDHVYVALPDGIAFTPDQGRTWSRRDQGIRRKFTQTLKVDRTRAGRVVAGTELGIFLSEDFGRRWRGVGAGGLMVTHIAQSRSRPEHWLATMQRGGLWSSRDRGVTWARLDGPPEDQTLHNAAFDSRRKDRLAVCGWGPGVMVSEDGGKTWDSRNAGLPSARIWRSAFDPDHEGRLYASVHEEAVFVSSDAGRTWKRGGLEGSIVHDFVFVPEAGK